MAPLQQRPKKKIKAVVLAAGYATRLYPLTLNIPKPLLKVKKDKAVIDFIIDDLNTSPLIDEIIVVTNHKFYRDFSDWEKKRKNKLKVTILDDRTFSNKDRLGAIGDIYFAVRREKITSDLLVVGGDNLFDCGFSRFVKFALKHRPFSCLGLFDIRRKKKARRFGVVSLKRDKRVFSFQEKPSHPQSTLVAMCLYYFPQETFKCLNKYVLNRKTSKDASGNYIKWLLKEDRVYGFVFNRGRWYDIGHLDSYKEVVVRFNTVKRGRG